MFRRILIANRGEIALRVIRTAREMGIETRRGLLRRRRARRCTCAWRTTRCRSAARLPRESYLASRRSLAGGARRPAREAIHPGYGFLSENAAFARAVMRRGPRRGSARRRRRSRRWATRSRAAARCRRRGVPVVPGPRSIRSTTPAAARAAAETIGYPDRAQGRGRRRRQGHPHRARRRRELESAFRTASGEAQSSFGDGRVYLERYLDQPRHIEVQVLFDAARQRRALRRARVLDPAPPPEADRGVPVGRRRRDDCASAMGAAALARRAARSATRTRARSSSCWSQRASSTSSR